MTFPARNRKLSSADEGEEEEEKENKGGQTLGRDFSSMMELFGGMRRDK